MAADTGTSFGELLRGYRAAVGLTQDELAELSGLSARGIADLECGARTAPYPQTTRRLADALGLDSDGRAALMSARQRAQAVARRRPSSDGVATVAAGPVDPRHPGELGHLIGREEVYPQTLALLADPATRLVTLMGPGGCGKTRVALEVAPRSAPSRTDGVVFVDLSPVSDPGLVMPAIARAVGLGEAPVSPALSRVRSALRERHLLLLLDNFEQVVADKRPLTCR